MSQTPQVRVEMHVLYGLKYARIGYKVRLSLCFVLLLFPFHFSQPLRRRCNDPEACRSANDKVRALVWASVDFSSLLQHLFGFLICGIDGLLLFVQLSPLGTRFVGIGWSRPAPGRPPPARRRPVHGGRCSMAAIRCASCPPPKRTSRSPIRKTWRSWTGRRPSAWPRHAWPGRSRWG